VLLAAGPLWACYTPAPTPVGSPIEPLPSVGARVPDDPDLLARDLAAAALGEPRVMSKAKLQRLASLDRELRDTGQPRTGLVPVAAALVNATLDDPIAYRHASRPLLERDDLSPTLRRRIEAAVEDDPLRLADRRLRDSFLENTAEVFNAIVAPASRALTTPLMGAVALARSLVNLALSERMEDELEFRERQALAHWKSFLEAHPDALEAPEIARRTEETQRRWNQTRHDRALRRARMALEHEHYSAAVVLAQRAERYRPEDADALAIREQAAAELMRVREQRPAAPFWRTLRAGRSPTRRASPSPSPSARRETGTPRTRSGSSWRNSPTPTPRIPTWRATRPRWSRAPSRTPTVPSGARAVATAGRRRAGSSSARGPPALGSGTSPIPWSGSSICRRSCRC
jgi:hypothetical protein